MSAGARGAIAVIRLDQIGDVVLTGPFLAALRRARAQTRIVLVVRPQVEELARRLAEVDEVLTLRAIPVRRGSLIRKFVAERRLAWKLRRLGTDVAMVPRWDLDIYDAIHIARLSGAPVRAAFERAAGENARHGLTHVVHAPPTEHEARKPQRLLDALGITTSGDAPGPRWYGEHDESAAAAELPGPGDGEPVALGIAAREPRRQWPVERFVAIAQGLARERHIVPVLVGGPGDRHVADRFKAEVGMRCVDVVGRASLPVTAATLARCALFVGNDSAPMHLAAAAGVPVVEVSCHPATGDDAHAQSPLRFGPHGVPAAVLRPSDFEPPCADSGSCSAEAAHCILGVSVEDVLAGAQSLLAP
jgi:heptosyltransferase-2